MSEIAPAAGRVVGAKDVVVAVPEERMVGVCGKNLVRTDGTMRGESTLSATDDSGASIGGWLAGEP